MARISHSKVASGKRILLVDDEEEYRLATQILLTREGYEVITATNGREAVAILRQHHFDLVLLDYFMPGGITGETVVEEIRKFNQSIQVILQTGYSGECPSREMLSRLDIQGYYDKTEGPEKLLLWVEAGLKTAGVIQSLNRSRQGLQFILDVTPQLHKIQTLDQLLQGILTRFTGLAGAVSSFLAVITEEQRLGNDSGALLVGPQERAFLQIKVAAGRFLNQGSLESYFDSAMIELMHQTLSQMKVKFTDTYTIIPLTGGGIVVGVIFLEHNNHIGQDEELLRILANQAVLAIQNTRLYEMAINDKLTGVYVRNFFNQWLLRELRTSFRQQWPLSLIMLDLDGLKEINDRAGHAGGDQALAMTGSVLKEAMAAGRSTDFVGRYGGDEFVIILPDTPLEHVHIIIERIQNGLMGKSVTG
ncbi:MAG TPA: diguanylate cyclase, partial [Bacillota bacterium]|nr:diguanylate cyclase [Bacillota bacterium]